MYKLGPTQKKILLVLLGGVTLGLTHSHKQYFKALKQIKKDWQKINQYSFQRSIRKLADDKLLEEKTMPDGNVKLVLTAKGKKEAQKLNLFGHAIKFKKPKRWDGKWRIVIFDIPEENRIFRDILRNHLYNLKFHKLQNSVFISPYPFEKQIQKLIEIYSAQAFVQVITAEKIDNEGEIKRRFFK